MADGVVVHVGYFTGKYSDNPWWIEPSFAGYVVTVDYGDYLSHYAHCSGSPVLSGKRVQQGDVVAYSGNTGSATSGPHCHWEVMPNGWNFQNGTYGRIDPRTITTGTIASQGAVTTVQEDELSDAQVERIINEVTLNMESKHVMTRKAVADAVKSINFSTQQHVEAVGRVTQQLIIDNASPADIAASIPQGIAQAVADELAKRLVK
jgi:hypothetical protein